MTISKRKQQGVALILTAIVLAAIMAAAMLSLLNTTVMEQRITANDIRAKEVQEAAKAGLNYAVAWSGENYIGKTLDDLGTTLTCVPGAATSGCPALDSIPAISSAMSTSTESYSYSLIFKKVGDGIRITSVATGVNDPTISSTYQVTIGQIAYESVRDGGAPPWVLAGCVTNPPTAAALEMLLANPSSPAVSNGEDCSAYDQQGAMALHTWDDVNNDGTLREFNGNIVDFADTAGNPDDERFESVTPTMTSTSFTSVSGSPMTCGATVNCAWKQVFNEMQLAEAINIATEDGQVYDGSSGNLMPCGAPKKGAFYQYTGSSDITPATIDSTDCPTITGHPSTDNVTIGTPDQPVIIIVQDPTPSDGSGHCPGFGNLVIYGMVYYDSTDLCDAHGWSGTDIYGSVIWESDMESLSGNINFIEVPGDDTDPNHKYFTLKGAAAIPGTWIDF